MQEKIIRQIIKLRSVLRKRGPILFVDIDHRDEDGLHQIQEIIIASKLGIVVHKVAQKVVNIRPIKIRHHSMSIHQGIEAVFGRRGF